MPRDQIGGLEMPTLLLRHKRTGSSARLEIPEPDSVKVRVVLKSGRCRIIPFETVWQDYQLDLNSGKSWPKQPVKPRPFIHVLPNRPPKWPIVAIYR